MGAPEDNIELTQDSKKIEGPGTTKLKIDHMLVVQSVTERSILIESVDHEKKTAQLSSPWPGPSGTYEYPDWEAVPLRNVGGRRFRPAKAAEKPKPGI